MKSNTNFPIVDPPKIYKSPEANRRFMVMYRQKHRKEYIDYGRSYYQTHKSEVAERRKQSRKHIADYLNKLKEAHPCADCGLFYRCWQMQFDHIDPTTKSYTIASARGQCYSIKSINKELLKCELVCANCHATRTHRQRLVYRDFRGLRHHVK